MSNTKWDNQVVFIRAYKHVTINKEKQKQTKEIKSKSRREDWRLRKGRRLGQSMITELKYKIHTYDICHSKTQYLYDNKY